MAETSIQGWAKRVDLLQITQIKRDQRSVTTLTAYLII